MCVVDIFFESIMFFLAELSALENYLIFDIVLACLWSDLHIYLLPDWFQTWHVPSLYKFLQLLPFIVKAALRGYSSPSVIVLVFFSYCPLLFFIVNFCPDHNFYTIQAVNFKLYWFVDLSEEMCVAHEL